MISHPRPDHFQALACMHVIRAGIDTTATSLKSTSYSSSANNHFWYSTPTNNTERQAPLHRAADWPLMVIILRRRKRITAEKSRIVSSRSATCRPWQDVSRARPSTTLLEGSLELEGAKLPKNDRQCDTETRAVLRCYLADNTETMPSYLVVTTSTTFSCLSPRLLK